MVAGKPKPSALAPFPPFRSVGDRVLVRPQNDEYGEKTTCGGIILPATRRDSKPMREGIVLSVGGRVEHVCAGERVFWPTPAGDFADGERGYELMSLLESDIAFSVEA